MGGYLQRYCIYSWARRTDVTARLQPVCGTAEATSVDRKWRHGDPRWRRRCVGGSGEWRRRAVVVL